MIDTHAHYSLKRYEQYFRWLASDGEAFSVQEGNFETLLASMREAGITAAVEPSIHMSQNRHLLDFCAAHPDFLYPAIGVHPTRTPFADWSQREELAQHAAEPRVVAIGEAGLDYHLNPDAEAVQMQKKWFTYQIELAHGLKLPLILHIRGADEDALEILHRYRRNLHGGVVHCYAGDWETARRYMELELCLGIGGSLLQPERQEVLEDTVRQMPAEGILLETDAPCVLPFGRERIKAGKIDNVRNSSLILPAVLRKIAELRELSYTVAERITTQNAERLFPAVFSKPVSAS